MAKDPDSPDIRFPLRRSAVPPEPVPPPAPEKPKKQPIAWRPRPVETEPQPQWFEQQAPSPQRFEPLELTNVAPQPERTVRGWTPTPPPPPPYPPAYPQPGDPGLPPGGYTTNLPVAYKRRWWRWVPRVAAGFIVLFIVAVAWLALTAPLSKSLLPPAPPSITLLASDGTPIARRGAVIGAPVDAAKLPAHVRNAFVAIEDRRFYSHWGIDLRGITRAFVHNISGESGSQGGSTITQQLAKNAFLDSSRTASRKFQEVLIAFWLEGWLTKNEILSRYLSNVYFGDNVYGLRAAARHYFDRDPEDLTISQATLLAGLVQAPSRLAPTGNLKGARARQRLVVGAMVSAGLITKAQGNAVAPAVLNLDKSERPLPNGGYFADWVLPQARDRAGGVATEQTVRTTLEMRAQKAAERAVRNAGLKKAQIAIVAMRPDGSIVAMVGGTNYAASPFNRATQARRQPGSAFKLFVYLAALRGGLQPDDLVDDSPVTIGDWSPENSHGTYAGKITLRQAFAKSSNVVAARLTQRFGVRAVTRAARDLGISTPIGNDASISLGTSTVSLLELTAAYASIAKGDYPVRPKGLTDLEDGDLLGSVFGRATAYGGGQLSDMRELLKAVVETGTGRSAALAVPTFGKTGTTQDNRDALFVGYAGDAENPLIAGVWIGNDDNSPNAALSGGGLPARVWRDFMTNALNVRPAPVVVEEPIDNETDNGGISLEDLIEGVVSRIDNGTITTEVETDPEDRPPPPSNPPRREDATVPQRPALEERRAPVAPPTGRPRPQE
jgi:penicillin-binding protein 1A